MAPHVHSDSSTTFHTLHQHTQSMTSVELCYFYLINLWLPSMCHSELGAATL